MSNCLYRQCTHCTITANSPGCDIDILYVAYNLFIHSISQTPLLVRFTCSLRCSVLSVIDTREFTVEWWSWLIATGFFMACTWGSKVNGILTVVTIGIAVLVDLWDILDYKKGFTMVSFASQRLRHVTYPIQGTFLETFHGKSNRPHCRPIHHIPIILLRTLYCPHTFWGW